MLTHNALGAQLLAADLKTPAGWFPLLYNSPLSKSGSPARGGVPVLFPQFADTGPLPKHGWVRNVVWQLAEEGGNTTYQLVISNTDRADWPHACELQLRMQSQEATLSQASSQSLRITMTVRNTGNSIFSWTGGLHPYWEVGDLLGSYATGLEGLPVKDRFDKSLTEQPTPVLRWTDQPFERLVCACPPVQLHTPNHTLHLSAGGFTEWMVWNPGASGALALSDLPDADWQRFVCIEPVCVSQPVVLEPGAVFEGWLQVELLAAK